MSIIASQSQNSNLCSRKCGQRTCRNDNCRRLYCYRETCYLWYSHRFNNFTHHLRITPPSYLSEDEKVIYLRRRLDKLRMWNKHHPDNQIDIALYPHRSDKGVLHWHGAVRVDSLGCNVLRRTLGMPGKRGNREYCLKKLTDWKYQLGYITGKYHQPEMGVIKVVGCPKLCCNIGSPHVLPKKDIEYIYRFSGWAGCRSVFTTGRLPRWMHLVRRKSFRLRVAI